MRRIAVIALVFAGATARADDAIRVDAAVGAGAQGAATYGGVEVGLDASWPGVRLGLGVRGIWDDGVFRRADWARLVDAVAIVRDVELTRDAFGARLALAAGRLAPAHIARIAVGYRSDLDDRWRTGARPAATARDLEVGVEIDDVLDPALVGGAVRWQLATPWAAHAAVAIDPGAHTATAIELGTARRFAAPRERVDLGASIVAEPGLGASAVAFADAAAQRGSVNWTARADVRAGSGTVGSLFGPLYRIERLAHGGTASLWDRARGRARRQRGGRAGRRHQRHRVARARAPNATRPRSPRRHRCGRADGQMGSGRRLGGGRASRCGRCRRASRRLGSSNVECAASGTPVSARHDGAVGGVEHHGLVRPCDRLATSGAPDDPVRCTGRSPTLPRAPDPAVDRGRTIIAGWQQLEMRSSASSTSTARPRSATRSRRC